MEVKNFRSKWQGRPLTREARTKAHRRQNLFGLALYMGCGLTISTVAEPVKLFRTVMVQYIFSGHTVFVKCHNRCLHRPDWVGLGTANVNFGIQLNF